MIIFYSSHAITSDVSLAETAELTSFFMSDGLIITGNKTGSPASLRDVKGKHLTYADRSECWCGILTNLLHVQK